MPLKSPRCCLRRLPNRRRKVTPNAVSADGETEHSVAYSLVRSVGIPAVLSHERHAVVAVHKSKFNSRSIHRPVVPILVGRFERYGKVEYLLVVILLSML